MPVGFIQRMQTLLGDEAPAFLQSYEEPPTTGVRVNLLKTDVARFVAAVPWTLDPVPWCPSGLYVRLGERLGKHPYHAAGVYYVQEPSAMAVAEALDIAPGQHVLDLAAAPGGKTTHIASLLGNTGVLVANEVETSRIKGLGENLERWGARNVVLVNERVERLAVRWGARFDRVLLDAPCSGEGMFRKNAAARAEWSAQHVAGCAARQERILEHAARLVRPGGRMVYSTCTFAPEENEQQIAAFLDAHPDWVLVPVAPLHGFAPARPDWTAQRAPALAQAVRLWPHRLEGEGHFIAVLQHTGTAVAIARDVPEDPPRRKRRADAPARRTEVSAQGVVEQWQDFRRRFLRDGFGEGTLAVRADRVYLVPAPCADDSELAVVRPGLWLGTAKPGRFEPAHALALALRPYQAADTTALALPDAVRYLQGAALERAGPDGWTLITLDGWSLGWGRRSGGIVKNLYPKGLRWSG
jgi:NOL1/NOP2/sun family putative RNA methylase